jgi:hypothetical protein
MNVGAAVQPCSVTLRYHRRLLEGSPQLARWPNMASPALPLFDHYQAVNEMLDIEGSSELVA